ncbi:Ribonuclease H2 subunit C [Penicillium cinerascens]|uniref:Ribonuclease H2 subunit C n=1 Tax=Penicillium cinerascens TaxID=70096 RepID=A0A9W9JFZ3_9EURO|nr:Ribonuclease H2 subunit C [Penicillium cinerascens]KAJ5195267.1 Ribonuclease H2 subunit C [Penicillium cinerascens]
MPDMYTFQSPKYVTQSEKDCTPRLTPNILPCRIHHDGPIDSTDRFWTPETDARDNNQSSYFRGRKLRGRRVTIPEGYTGIVATLTDRVSQQPVKNASAEDEVTELEEPVNILETQGTFDDMIVWGHEILPAADDPYVKGVEEWVRFAETMHGTPARTNGN